MSWHHEVFSFGWSLPAGCGRLPGEEPEYERLRCSHCGSFLPDRHNETAQVPYFDDATATERRWRCKRCGKVGYVDI